MVFVDEVVDDDGDGEFPDEIGNVGWNEGFVVIFCNSLQRDVIFWVLKWGVLILQIDVIFGVVHVTMKWLLLLFMFHFLDNI